LSGLPGGDLVQEGLVDLAQGRVSVAAYLVAIALPRLQRAGLGRGLEHAVPAEPELRLYRLLRERGGNAYGHYNALLRLLVSCERALERCPPPAARAPNGRAQTGRRG
jgi:hypothetical protein